MSRALAALGFVALCFGLGSFYATGRIGGFAAFNLAVGSLAVIAALGARLARLWPPSGAGPRRVVARGLLLVAGALLLAVGLERTAARSNVRLDWTFERRYQLAPATLKVCEEHRQRELRVTLYSLPFDPRVRRTRTLLGVLAEACGFELRERDLERDEQQADRFQVGSSNSVVIELGDRFQSVERPTEGALYEALYRLRSLEAGSIALLRGEGEGDIERVDGLGYSGLAAALETEGYRVRVLVGAALGELPDEIDAVLAIAPRRRLPEQALGALRRYLERGGRLVAMLEPGVASGLEEILTEYGLSSPDAVVVDPDSGRLEGIPSGVGILASAYASHPATRGLDRNRMTFFPSARAFRLRKPRVEDRLDALVLTGHRAWLLEDSSLLAHGSARLEPDGAAQGYQPIAVAGRYPRPTGETRIVAFGDSEFAANRSLRTLYNLDLLLNAVHWSVERPAEITLRPKIPAAVQFPLPLRDTLTAFYGIGLLVPELLLLAGAVAWLRRRSA